MTLAEFILARVAEDEAEAWRWCADAGGGDLDPLEARVLRQCEAFRRIVSYAFECAHSIDGEWGDSHTAAEIQSGKCSDHGADAAVEHLAPLASIWSDHPDYRQEWVA